MINKVSLSWKENGDWKIANRTSAEQFHHKIRTTGVRPASVTIRASHWEEADLLKLLTDISKIDCQVYLKPDDAFVEFDETTYHLVSSFLTGKQRWVWLSSTSLLLIHHKYTNIMMPVVYCTKLTLCTQCVIVRLVWLTVEYRCCQNMKF